MRGIAVDQRVVFRSDGVGRVENRPFLAGDRGDAGRGRLDQDSLDRRGRAIGLEQRDERLADLELRDRLGDVHLRVGPEGLGRGLHRLLIARREGPKRVLHAIAELAGDFVRDVDRVLRDEIDADTLGADQADDLLDLVEQGRRGVVEQQMGFVEEEAQLGLRQVADLGQLLKQLGQEPEQEGRVEPRARHQLVGGEDVDDPAPAVVECEEIFEFQRRFAEEMVAALAAQLEQRALDRADGRLADIAVFERQLVGALSATDQHRLQIVEIEQEHAVLVGDVEGDGHHALLHLVEVQQTRQQQRAHLRDRRADRVTLLAEQVPKLHRTIAVLPVAVSDLGGAAREDVVHLAGRGAGHGKARQVALNVRDEGRNAGGGESFDDTLEGHRLAGARRARDQPMAIGPVQLQPLRIGATGRTPNEYAARRFAAHAFSLADSPGAN